MANYLFEQMTDAQALAYDPTKDDLFFLTGTAGSLGVKYNAAAGLSNASITLTQSGVSHTFAADALANENLTFFENPNDHSTIKFGSDSNGDTGANATVTGTAGFGARYFGLGGADNITGSNGNDTIWGGEGGDTITGKAAASTTTDAYGDPLYKDVDWLNGGNGADTITGSAANDHIWGNESASAQGTGDLGDLLSGGAGNDYINGNAGNDTIDGGDGNDRLFGGADDDTINGGDGWDYLQGNKGNDTLNGDAGFDQIRGGAGNDTIRGGADWDTLTGDAGNDTFVFRGSEASNSNVGNITADYPNLTDAINDFTHGSGTTAADVLDIGFTVNHVLHAPSGTAPATSVGEAQLYANNLLSTQGAAGDVAAVQVGNDTFLFYNSAGTAGTASNSAIELVNVTANDLSATRDFHYNATIV